MSVNRWARATKGSRRAVDPADPPRVALSVTRYSYGRDALILYRMLWSVELAALVLLWSVELAALVR
jgi:hypothetical protein